MYYVQDLLAYRTGTFGKLWFVAHQGKLKNRRDYESIEVAKKCEELLKHFPFAMTTVSLLESYSLHGVPLSIRTCSHLMFGIVLVFHKQMEYLYQDSQRFLANLKPMKLSLKEPKRKDLAFSNDFILDNPPLPENWELEMISPTEQARLLEKSQNVENPFLNLNASHLVDDIRDITLREEGRDSRLAASSMYRFPREIEGLDPDDQALTEEEKRQQWVLMNSSTDVIAEYLSSNVFPPLPHVDPGVGDLLGIMDLQNLQTQVGLELQQQQEERSNAVSKEIQRIQKWSPSGAKCARISECEGMPLIHKGSSLKDKKAHASEENRENINQLGLNLDVTNYCDVSMGLSGTLHGPSVLGENINLYNAGLSVSLPRVETPLTRTSSSQPLNREMLSEAAARTSETEGIEKSKFPKRVTPLVEMDQSEIPHRTWKRDSILGRVSESRSIQPHPFMLQDTLDRRSKRRPKHIDFGPIRISDRAMKRCLTDSSDIVRPFVPAPLSFDLKADELVTSAGRASTLGSELKRVWGEAFGSRGDFSQPELPLAELPSLGLPSAEVIREAPSANNTKNTTEPLATSGRQVAELSKSSAELADQHLLSFENSELTRTMVVENETLRTIQEGRETSLVSNPVFPQENSLAPPVSGARNSVRTGLDSSLDFDSSLSMNKNDEVIFERVGKLVEASKDENERVFGRSGTILFSQLCPVTSCKKREACRAFYSLLNIAKAEKIEVDQPRVSEARKIRDPIYVKVARVEGRIYS